MNDEIVATNAEVVPQVIQQEPIVDVLVPMTQAKVVQTPQGPIVDVPWPMTQAGIVHMPHEQIVDVPVPVPVGKEILQTQESGF